MQAKERRCGGGGHEVQQRQHLAMLRESRRERSCGGCGGCRRRRQESCLNDGHVNWVNAVLLVGAEQRFVEAALCRTTVRVRGVELIQPALILRHLAVLHRQLRQGVVDGEHLRRTRDERLREVVVVLVIILVQVPCGALVELATVQRLQAL